MNMRCCICGGTVENSLMHGLNGFNIKGGRVVCCNCAGELGYNKDKIRDRIAMGRFSIEELAQKLNTVPYTPEKSKLLSFGSYKGKSLSEMTYEELQGELQRYIVKNPEMSLKLNEICYFSTPCQTVHYKNVVVGTRKNSVHFGNGRNGRYLGSGTAYTENNRQNVAEKYDGHFFMTNMRMVCNAAKYSFEIPLSEISAITANSDGITVMSNGKSSTIIFQRIENFKSLLRVNNEIEQRKQRLAQNESNQSVLQDTDIPSVLREYKALLDEGIISQEEFQHLKKQVISGKDYI